MSADLLVFDLDGTLVDSQRDLADAVNATRAWMGLDPLPPVTVAQYVGNGAPVLVQRALPDAGIARRIDVHSAIADHDRPRAVGT